MKFSLGRSMVIRSSVAGLIIFFGSLAAGGSIDHVSVCGEWLGDSVGLREIFGASTADSELLLRFVDQIDHEVAALESQPARMAELLPKNGWRTKFAIANYVRTQLHAVLDRYRQNRHLRTDPTLDHELADLAEDERQLLIHEIFTHQREILNLVDGLINGGDKNGSVIVEFGAAPGQTLSDGQIDLLAGMYTSFARRHHWLVDELNQTGPVGISRSLTLRLTGPGVSGWMPLESGVHRFVTTGGLAAINKNRVHTGYVAVTVYPEPARLDFNLDLSQVTFDTFRASGAGGQHVNTTDSAVRARHAASGLEATISTHRSQHRNKELALSILRAKLFARHQEEQRMALRATRARAAQTPPNARERYVRKYDSRAVDYDGVMAGDLKSIFAARLRLKLMRQIAERVEGIAK